MIARRLRHLKEHLGRGPLAAAATVLLLAALVVSPLPVLHGAIPGASCAMRNATGGNCCSQTGPTPPCCRLVPATPRRPALTAASAPTVTLLGTRAPAVTPVVAPAWASPHLAVIPRARGAPLFLLFASLLI